MKAWHFVGERLRDGRPVPPDGVVLRHTGPLVMCASGLHASLHPFDALSYAPSSTLCLVECGGTIIQEADKLVCSERAIIVRMNATPLLREFVRMQALSVAHKWDPPAVMLDYLITGDEHLRVAARDAARDAARRATARAAAWAAAEVAWVAARAARDAAEVAWDAAWAAAWTTAAKDAARNDFANMVNDAFVDYL